MQGLEISISGKKILISKATFLQKLTKPLAIYICQMKILMVCLGNICRSPLAEGILQSKANKLGLPIQVDSAGTANYHVGEAPHHSSQLVAKQNGVDISQQKCRQFKKTDFENFDKIYVMDSSNYDDVKRMAGNYFNANKIDLILNELYPHENREVPDPWYGGMEDFKKVYKMLDDTCDMIIKKFQAAQQQQQ